MKSDIIKDNGSGFREDRTDFNSVNISDIELAKSVVNKLSDVREDVVERVKEKYSDPNYEENAEDIAEKMLEKIKLLKMSETCNDE